MARTDETHQEELEQQPEQQPEQPVTQPQKSLAPIALEFQPDAIEIEERPVPPAARWMLYSLITFIALGVIWACVSEVDRVVSARGKIVTSDPMIILQPLETSIIRNINVDVGDTVKAGQELVTLDPTFTQADVSQLRARLESLRAQISRLEKEEKGDEFVIDENTASMDDRLQRSIYNARAQEYQARLDSFRDKLSNIEASIVTNQKEVEGLQSRSKVLGEIEKMFSELQQKEHGSKLRLLQSIDEKIVVETNLNATIKKTEELRRQAASLKAEQEAFLEEWRRKMLEEMVESRREESRTQEELSKALRRSNLISLRAPSDGIVLELAQRSVGSVIKEAEPMVTLVPVDANLEAEVELEPSNIGYISAGNEVRLKLDAFPFQKHGMINGVIQTISENTVQTETPSQTEDGKPLPAQRSVYRLNIKLTEKKLRNLPDHFRLIPGMTLTGEIRIGKRNVMTYFLYPFIKGLDESIREP